MLERLTIHQKLAALLLSVGLPTALAVLLGAHLLHGGQSELRELAETELPLARSLTRLVSDHGEQALIVERALSAPAGQRARHASEFSARADALTGDLAAVRKHVARIVRIPQDRGLVSDAASLEAQLDLVAEAEAAFRREAEMLFAAVGRPPRERLALRRAALASALTAALASVDGFSTRSVASAERDFRHALVAAALLLGLGLGLGGLGARRVMRQIDDALGRARKFAERVEHGVPIVDTGDVPDDQLGELLKALERTSRAVGAAQSGLALAEARSRAVVSAAHDGILTLDACGVIQSCNPPAERITGLAKNDLIGLQLDEVFAGSEWGDFGGFVRQLGGTREALCRRPSGAPVAIELSASELRYDGPLSYMLMFRDVSGRKELERAKNEFVSTVSHELRTPLTAIRGSLGLLENGVVGKLPEEGAEMVSIARLNCDRLIRLINDILDLERMEAGRLELHLEPLKLEGLIDSAFDGIRAVAEQGSVELESRLEPEALEATLNGDRDRMLQVLTNLLSNAIKFSPPGGRVEVSAGPGRRGWLRIGVSDEGPGIPAEQREQLFGKFQQLDSSDSRSKGGTGLGLAITKQIVEQHGGTIGVASEPGRGSTFWLELETGVARTPSKATRPNETRATRILVVEDDPELGRVMERLLDHAGYRVGLATDLASARLQLAEGAPDLLLLDVNLPDGNGLDLVADLDATSAAGATQVIVLSGSSEPGEELAMPLVFDWMRKPFESPQLLTAIQQATCSRAGARVLVVDDDPDTRRVIRSQLESLGMQCDEAADGATAIARVVASRPDLLVLDLGIPVMDGFSVVEVLREAGPDGIPLLVYTGRDLSVDEREELRLGITRHLIKARTSPEEFVGTVVELIEAGRVKPSSPEIGA